MAKITAMGGLSVHQPEDVAVEGETGPDLQVDAPATPEPEVTSATENTETVDELRARLAWAEAQASAQEPPATPEPAAPKE